MSQHPSTVNDHPEGSCKACPEYVALSRRGFIGATGLSIAALSVPGWLPRVAYAKSHNSAALDVVVQIYLRGGCDGLSIVAPWNETNYVNARPTIKLDAPGSGPNGVIDLVQGNTAPSPTAPGGQVVFGFHPAMAPLMQAYNDGKMAVIQAAGMTNASKSHFDAQKFMEAGKLNDLTVATGWLGRHIATQTTPMRPNPTLRAIGIADGLQRSLIGADKALPIPDLQNNPGTPPALSNFTNYGLAGTTSTRTQRRNTIDALYDTISGPMFESANNTISTITLLNQIGAAGYAHSIAAGNNPNAYPTTSLGNALKSTAALINADVGVEAVAIDYGGWDTHQNQGLQSNGLITDPTSAMFRQIDTLAKAISAFYADIIVGKGRNVCIVVMSEFGRRIGQNGTVGTDHGYGNLMFVVGNAVVGRRVITNWPGISPNQPATNQDLGMTIDYRDILAEIITDRLGNGESLSAIFPGFTPTFRGVVA